MADYYLILKRALEREPDLDAQERQALYDKARAALARQLDALDPAPAPEQIARVRDTLESAVDALEAEFGPDPQSDAEDEPASLILPDAPPEPVEAPPPLVTPAGADLAQATALVEGATRTLSRRQDAGVARDYADDTLRDSAQPTARYEEPGGTPAPDASSRPNADQPRDGDAYDDPSSSEPDAWVTPAHADEDDADFASDVVGEIEVEPHDSGWEPRSASAGSAAPPAAKAGPLRWPAGRSRDDKGADKAADRAGQDIVGPKAPGARRGAVPEALAKRQRGRSAWPVAAALVLIALLIGGIGLWQRDALMAAVQTAAPVETVVVAPVEETAASKNVERITSDGVTVAPDASVTTTAGSATPTATADPVRDVGGDTITPIAADQAAEVALAAPEPTTPTRASPVTVPAGSADAVLFEERLLAKGQGDRFAGSVTWTAEREPGADQGEEMILRGLVSIPDRNLDVLLTVRENDDETLPASHTIELLFETGDGFAPGGVANVMGILMKPTEETQLGTPLKGASARITDGYFLIGLSSLAQDEAKNVQLLQDEPRLEIPILYNNGQRAILELQKGSDGDTAFAEAFGAWAG